MKTDESIFKLRVKEILKEKNMTQKELAAQMGKSPQYIANVLNAEQGISINVLIEFAKNLNVEFRDLFATTRTEVESVNHPPTLCPHCGKPITIKLGTE